MRFFSSLSLNALVCGLLAVSYAFPISNPPSLHDGRHSLNRRVVAPKSQQTTLDQFFKPISPDFKLAKDRLPTAKDFEEGKKALRPPEERIERMERNRQAAKEVLPTPEQLQAGKDRLRPLDDRLKAEEQQNRQAAKEVLPTPEQLQAGKDRLRPVDERIQAQEKQRIAKEQEAVFAQERIAKQRDTAVSNLEHKASEYSFVRTKETADGHEFRIYGIKGLTKQTSNKPVWEGSVNYKTKELILKSPEKKLSDKDYPIPAAKRVETDDMISLLWGQAAQKGHQLEKITINQVPAVMPERIYRRWVDKGYEPLVYTSNSNWKWVTDGVGAPVIAALDKNPGVFRTVGVGSIKMIGYHTTFSRLTNGPRPPYFRAEFEIRPGGFRENKWGDGSNLPAPA